MFKALGECGRAKEYHETALAIRKEIGDRRGEASSYGNLGTVFFSLGEYCKAKEYLKKALLVRKDIGDIEGEAAVYGNLGSLFNALGEYGQAREYFEKALVIAKNIGVRKVEGSAYGNLGTVFIYFGEYGKAKEYHEKALEIRKEIGDRDGEASSYGNLGSVFRSVNEYGKAKEYYEKALAISKEIGDREGEAANCGNLGTVFIALGEYGEAKKFLEEALVISKEIGHRKGEGSSYGNLGAVFKALGEYGKDKQYLEQALAIRKEVGDVHGEAIDYGNLGYVFTALGEFVKAKEYYNKALAIGKDIGAVESELILHTYLAFSTLMEGDLEEGLANLHDCVNKYEDMLGLIKGHDEFKVCLADAHAIPFEILSLMLFATGNPIKALYVVELRRARALAHLLSAHYCVASQVSGNPLSSVAIDKIMEKGKQCTYLYISYTRNYISLWVLKPKKAARLRLIDAKRLCAGEGSINDLSKFLRSDITFTKLHVRSKDHCEDRCWFPSENEHESTEQLYQKESLPGFRLLEEDGEEDKEDQPEPTLSLYYQLIIAPVADALDESEIVVPERGFYKVPFAALKDECGKYFSESFRIRIIPSLTTLKIIQDCPLDYHSQSGALIVDDPEVGHVMYKGRLERKSPLPCARKEAEMIGRLLDAKPLVGKHATKQVVLQRINSVSLIHFAAHGNADRGEIALAPLCPTNGYAQEEGYLLTMADISKVQLRAKLVVLSCCHSASGQVRAEGVVGIARAFLGSGACSVLVALWALEDSATEQLMSRFYEHLVRGESASESLHQAMKWMRSNSYSDVRDWAPFMLIGDDVTFDFAQ